jgi:predicted small metal-binding protein
VEPGIITSTIVGAPVPQARCAAWNRGEFMKTTLDCPCGERILASNEDELVDKAKAHLKEKHPDHDYSREEILFLAF